ncbi:MAG: hypothetical protein KDK91_12030 [Gammaproteobacteria bacterium]|nr:hypothetical protein [Gammaproteobacteria bacterium]
MGETEAAMSSLCLDAGGAPRLEDLLAALHAGVPRLHMPMLVSGRLWAAASGVGDGAPCYRLAPPADQPFDSSRVFVVGEQPRLVYPRLDPRLLLFGGARALDALCALQVDELLRFVAALRERLQSAFARVRVRDPQLAAAFAQLPALLDGDGLAAAIDRELAMGGHAGRRFLDGWVSMQERTHVGATEWLASERLRADWARAPEGGGCVRALPTRQLHVTAGNAPLIPVLSWLRALASKSAAVIKCPAESSLLAGLLGVAMHDLDPRHPLTTHSSFVYWPGGLDDYESVLFADGNFDRLVVWGAPDTVRSVRERALGTRTVFFNPRFGLSLIDLRGVTDEDEGTLQAIAERATIDTLIADQHACTASLVHYVIGSAEQALRYAERLSRVLAEWDAMFPPMDVSGSAGRIRSLRRGELIRARWFVNGTSRAPRSVVVCSDLPFDVMNHPMSRFVVVRPIDDEQALRGVLSEAVSSVGVHPESLRLQVRDWMGCMGVSNIRALGAAERSYAGMPHDGMRVLSELVNWANG